MHAEDRIKVEARIVHGVADAWFRPGAGRSEWFKDHEHAPEMVVVPAGSFMMGSKAHQREQPRHRVTITMPFAVSRFAVPFAEWDAAGLPHHPGDQGWGRGSQPVINVSWEDARAYAGWLSQATGKAYRLLSEAEWEYVARAGTTRPGSATGFFWWGDAIATKQANYDGNYTFGNTGLEGEFRQRTLAVDAFEPNPWGLYHVHGNVWEWCEDNWHPDYKGAPQDGSPWPGGDATHRVLRGGSWASRPQALRSANRNWGPPAQRSHNTGFRVARTLAL